MHLSQPRGAVALAESVLDEGSTLSDVLLPLVERASRGDEEAKRALLEAVVGSVRRTCRAVLGARHADLDDAVQDSLIGVLRSLSAYRFEGQFLHYVTKIALRVAVHAKRSSASPLRAAFSIDDQARARRAPSEVEDGERHLQRVEALRLLIGALPSVQAEALLLRFVLGYSLAETAAITEVPANTAKTRIRLAKQGLRTKISEDPRLRGLFERFAL